MPSPRGSGRKNRVLIRIGHLYGRQAIPPSRWWHQRAGEVVEFSPYSLACVDRYVGAMPEELPAEAMRVGSHASDLLAALGANASPAPRPCGKLVAQRAGEVAKVLRERLAKRSAEENKAQQTLL